MTTVDPRLALSAMRYHFGPLGWRVFRSKLSNGQPGSWWATTGSSDAWEPTPGGGILKDGAVQPAAIERSTWQELAAELRKRLGGA